MYGGGSVDNNNDNDGGGRMGGGDCYLESIDPVLDSLPDLYSELNVFFCKS